MTNEYLALINPNAGNGKGKKDWDQISSALKNEGISFHAEFTAGKGAAVNLAKKYIERGIRSIILVSGDGTLNEAANGILEQNICPSEQISLGMIPVGTGNDWARTFGIPQNYEAAVKIIANNKSMLQDAGKANFFNEGAASTRRFLNVAGIGFDALVAHKVNIDKEKGKKGAALFVKNLIGSLFSYNYHKISIIFDSNEIETELFSMSLGIGKYNGGGMMMVPGAIPDNGRFDITLIKKISKFGVLKNVKNLFDGSFTKHPAVQSLSAEEVSVESDLPIGLELDGEFVGYSPFKFEIIPQALKVIAGGLNF